MELFATIVILVVVCYLLDKRITRLEKRVKIAEGMQDITDMAIDDLYEVVFPDDCDDCLLSVKPIKKTKKPLTKKKK